MNISYLPVSRFVPLGINFEVFWGGSCRRRRSILLVFSCSEGGGRGRGRGGDLRRIRCSSGRASGRGFFIMRGLGVVISNLL